MISDREQAVFECGIKLGSIFHQFIGTPVSARSKKSLEKAIEEAVKNQPFVESVRVKINLRKRGYVSLEGKMLDASVAVRFKSAKCKCRLKYIKDYPRMYIEEVRKCSA
ncbi:MAG: dihydroneopterin aldolase family protein [Candidatus Hydrothermarchaeota archaeon]|nr:dihydroneopterin aldolase family protein [Candidatus Hydrothermarchaeota archaeon]